MADRFGVLFQNIESDGEGVRGGGHNNLKLLILPGPHTVALDGPAAG